MRWRMCLPFYSLIDFSVQICVCPNAFSIVAKVFNLMVNGRHVILGKGALNLKIRENLVEIHLFPVTQKNDQYLNMSHLVISVELIIDRKLPGSQCLMLTRLHWQLLVKLRSEIIGYLHTKGKPLMIDNYLISVLMKKLSSPSNIRKGILLL